MMTNYNGSLLEAENATIPVNNRGLHFGDSVFETIRYAGGKLLFWEDHYFRLMSAMRILRMEIPMEFTDFLGSQWDPHGSPRFLGSQWDPNRIS